jgi:phosphopantothenoylcysteine decarboxylase/phosphopantothenate--cysteine ligase
MTTVLAGKRILFGVCGGIAAFKVAAWVRALRREEARVTVVMTAAASRFVSPLTFAALSGNRVASDMFDSRSAEQIPHISLARNSDLIMVAPTTAQTIARLAHGMADDLLATVILAADVPVIIYPAMNSRMYSHPATQANLVRLREFGYYVMEPAAGLMACGEDGPGRLPEWEEAREILLTTLSPADLAGQRVLVTAGPTREFIDPARFLSNPSTGKMGYCLARTARRRGAEVVLISGPSVLADPPGIKTIRVTTAAEMQTAVLDHFQEATIVVKAAAVADFRVATVAGQKVKKDEAALAIHLQRTPDILADIGERKKAAGRGPLLVGFAAESQAHLAAGRRKLAEKNLDLIVVNDIAGCDSGFAVDSNRVTMLDRAGGEETLPLLPKEEVADRIWDKVIQLAANGPTKEKSPS